MLKESMSKEAMLNALMEDGDFPLIECVYALSSNVNGDEVSAHAIHTVRQVSENSRLNALKRLVGRITGTPEIVNGFSYSKSENWTVADEIVKERRTYSHDDKFEVIWLQRTQQYSWYRGNAGCAVFLLRGIVLQYPEEMED